MTHRRPELWRAPGCELSQRGSEGQSLGWARQQPAPPRADVHTSALSCLLCDLAREPRELVCSILRPAMSWLTNTNEDQGPLDTGWSLPPQIEPVANASHRQEVSGLAGGLDLRPEAMDERVERQLTVRSAPDRERKLSPLHDPAAALCERSEGTKLCCSQIDVTVRTTEDSEVEVDDRVSQGQAATSRRRRRRCFRSPLQGHEAISHPKRRQDVPRSRGIDLDLLSEPAHAVVYGSADALARVSPDLSQQLVP